MDFKSASLCIGLQIQCGGKFDGFLATVIRIFVVTKLNLKVAIFNIFSKRQKKLRGEVPDTLQYDLPNSLRVQITFIIQEAFGQPTNSYVGSSNHPLRAYEFIHDLLCKEYGQFFLMNQSDAKTVQLITFFLETKENEKALDVVECCFKYINTSIRNNENYYLNDTTVQLQPNEAINELNQRFKEHGVGYQFEGNEIIRLDSTYIHSEIVKPTITLLWNQKFLGANEEYLKAHEHYRHGRNKECLTECLKAFESAMKIICQEKGWSFDQNDTSRKLINICFQNNLVPPFTQNQFTSLQNLLESGIPTIRNKLGGHGQGQTLQKVDDEMTRYGLNLTGANIIFLVEQSGIK